MPNRTKLKIGDRIRLLAVPVGDLEQRARELAEGGHEEPGHTADTIERILALDPTVTIDDIDEWGHPWFTYEFSTDKANPVTHLIAIMDDESWEFV